MIHTGGDAELGAGREFDLVRELIARWGDAARGIGEDAAVLDLPPGERLVVSTDSSVEGVHFRRDWLTPMEIGYRAATAALSDLAAMGASPLGVVVGLSFPRSWRDDLREVADGIGEAVRGAGTHVIGGDITLASQLVLAVTVLGSAARPLRRTGARPGDHVYVTGTLGGPGAALASWLKGGEPDAAARQRFARPVARIAEGQWLAVNGATSCIDISDGLLGDASHLAAASGATLSLELERAPVLMGSPEDAARSGEEYELLVTAPDSLDADAFASLFGVPLTRIGRVSAGEPAVVATLHGRGVDSGRTFDHLSGR